MFMFRLLISSLAYVLIALSPAWACSCIGTPTAKLSDILESHTLVLATPVSTESLSQYKYTPLMSEYSPVRGTAKTIMADVSIAGEGKTSKLIFFHPTFPGSCAMAPQLGEQSWFLLKKDDAGTYKSNHCTDQALPYGAILDFYSNGVDPVVESKHFCPRNGHGKTPEEKIELLKKFPGCEIWLENPPDAFMDAQDVYVGKSLGLIP